MAVINDYVTEVANLGTLDKLEPVTEGGGLVYKRIVTFEVAAADDDTSKYRIARINSSDVISSILYGNDALTSGTDWDLGIYDTVANGGAVVEVDIFADGADLSSATAGAVASNGMVSVNIADRTKRVWELVSGLTVDPKKQYDLVWTANTVGSAAGTVTTAIEVIKQG
jgi:hypothetical protein